MLRRVRWFCDHGVTTTITRTGASSSRRPAEGPVVATVNNVGGTSGNCGRCRVAHSRLAGASAAYSKAIAVTANTGTATSKSSLERSVWLITGLPSAPIATDV